jgi:hypothetical protein
MVFLFPTDAALHFALTGGLVPPTVSLVPARFGLDAAGRPWIAPAVDVPRSLAVVLHRVGVETTANVPTGGRDISHWLETLPLRRDPIPPVLTDQTPVLFELPDPAGLSTLVGEMLRLGNDRQAFRKLGRVGRVFEAHRFCKTVGLEDSTHPTQSVLLRVIGPPYYSLLRAIDRNGPEAPRAYLERVPGLWVEVGWTHPLVVQIKPPKGQMLLLRPPAEWVAMADVPFRDVYDVLDFQVPNEPVAWADDPPDLLTVPLRLTAGNTAEPAEMWVLRGEAVEQIDALVRDADDRLLARLAFAVGDHQGEQVAVLRARPSKTAAPVLVLENALTCRPYLRLQNLYLPVGRRLRPPLRREAVRKLLADDADQVVWLLPRDDDSFVPESLPESAFRPLEDWVEYVLDRDKAALSAWAEAARFEFGTFVGRDDLVPAKRAEPKPRGAAAVVAETAKAKIKPPKPKVDIAPPVPIDGPFAVKTTTTPSELQVRLKAAEEQFLAVDGSLDDPRRLALWPELARLNAALGHTADASLAWANALWEPSDPPANWAWGWVEAERALPKPELTAADLDRLLANAKPTGPDMRPFAAALVWATRHKPVPAELRRRLPDVQRYLETHGHLLPVRIVWLIWHGLTGGDVLALARVRDRLLERLLAEGLGAERDLPGFLRFAGQREGDRLRTVRERAERLRQLAHKWSGFAAADGRQQTAAYIDLFFAFGFARLGEPGLARALMEKASAALGAADSEAHTFLLEAFRYRIDQAVAGKPHAGPLPAEQLEYLDQMRREADALPKDDVAGRLKPYLVERMKEQSRILDPQENFDPYRRITSKGQDRLIQDVVRLIDVTDSSQITKEIRRLTEQAAKASLSTRLRVLIEALPLAGRVGEALTGQVLAQVGPALNMTDGQSDATLVDAQAVLLERALLFAAHYDLSDLVRSFSDRLIALLHAPSGRSAVDSVSQLVGQTLRSLRKLGLRDQTERLLQQIANTELGIQSLEQVQAQAGNEWQSRLRRLLQLANGWLYFDRPEQARFILDAARVWILSPEKKSGDRSPLHYVSLVCAYVTAAGQTPPEEALGRVEELFASGRMDKLPNTFTSGPYYSRFHLNIVEAVVLTLATEDFAFGPAARRWLDDDEYLVRRRIHRDVRAALARAGM